MMAHIRTMAVVFLLAALPTTALAQRGGEPGRLPGEEAPLEGRPVEPAQPAEAPDAQFPDLARLTDALPAWRDLRAQLEDHGLTLGLAATQVFQFSGGGFNQRDAAAYEISLDLDLTLDFGKLVSPALDGLTFFIYAEYGAGKGLDPNHIGSISGVNADLSDPFGPLVAEYWLQYQKTIDRFTFRAKVGKIDPTGTFDTNAYANDETTQFLNGFLVNNPFAVPTPGGYLLGAELELSYNIGHEIVDGVYLSNGVFAANGNDATWGFDEAFNRTNGLDPSALWIGEAGVAINLPGPNGKLPGTYRVGLNYVGLPTQAYTFNTYGGALRPKVETGYNSVYVNVDQMVYKENADEADEQGLGVFARYGSGLQNNVEPGIEYPITQFYSLGLSYTGLVPTRDKDVLGFGWALTALNGYVEPGSGNPRYSDEQVFEWFYNINVFDWLQITPDLQYLVRPGGTTQSNDAVVAGLRVQIFF